MHHVDEAEPDAQRAVCHEVHAASSSGLASLILEACAAPLVMVDRCGHVVRVNTAFCAMSGTSPSQVLGTDVGDALGLPGGVQRATELSRAVHLGRPHDPAEQMLTDVQGRRRRVAWTFSAVPGGSKPLMYLIGTGADITRQRQAEATWRQKAETDPLTGLANRSVLEAALLDSLAQSGVGCGLLFCDLDDFKPVNDTHGHAVGDEVLRNVAARLATAVRGSDLVARIGGDEFVVLLPSAGPLEVRAVVPRIERSLASPMTLELRGGQTLTVRVRASIGTYVADPGDDPATVLAQADAQMYRVKASRQAARERVAALTR